MAAEAVELEDAERRSDERAGIALGWLLDGLGVKRRDGAVWVPKHFYPRCAPAPSKRGWRAAKERLLMYFGHANKSFEHGAPAPKPPRRPTRKAR